MTATDQAIIDALRPLEDGATATELARSTAKHETTVRRRLDKLEAAGAIHGTRADGTTRFFLGGSSGHPSLRTAQGSRQRARRRDERIADLLADRYPQQSTRQEIAEATGFNDSDTYISLRRLSVTGEAQRNGRGRAATWAATMRGRRT